MTQRTLPLASLLLAAALPLGAQAPAAKPATGTPSLVVTAENRTAAAEAARGAKRAIASARPGDVLRYQLVFSNPGTGAIRGVKLENPVPAGMRFVPGSATASRTDAKAEYSVDGGQRWSATPMDTVVVDGRRIVRPAAAGRYTHVRWMVAGSVQPGTTVTAAFEARVNDGAAKSDSDSTTRASSPAQAPRGR